MIRAVIGNYQLVRKLGKGGMGVVYLGQHKLLGRQAAIKVLLPTLSARQDIVNRFFNEARAVTSISDPGIVQVFDFGYHSDGSAFIVMEYLEGEPLDRRLGRLGRLPAVDALRLCRQLASSLAAAHARRIIHRDLKPENIYLIHDPEVASGERTKILDFGIAKLSDDHPDKLKTSTGMLRGRRRTCRPSSAAGSGISTIAPTSTPSAACCSACSPADRRSMAKVRATSSRRTSASQRQRRRVTHPACQRASMRWCCVASPRHRGLDIRRWPSSQPQSVSSCNRCLATTRRVRVRRYLSRRRQ